MLDSFLSVWAELRMMVWYSLVLALAVAVVVAGVGFKFRHDWSAGKLFTPLGKTIDSHQANCTNRIHFHRQNNWGMGSDIHTWSQAICNSMQVGATLVQLDEQWIWNDLSFCPNVKQPLGCYFRIEKHCPGATSMGTISWKHDYNRCPKYIQDDRTRQEFRAAAMEYLFSHLDKRLVQEAEAEIKGTFGAEGIPDDMITVHLRWGDKKLEMKLVSQEEFVDAIDGLAKNYSIANPKIFITTESKHALESMEGYVKEHRKSWTLYNYGPSVYETRVVEKKTNETLHHNPMALARHTGGKIGKASIIALMMALEAKYYVLTSGSNWSRLIDELRRNVVNHVCGNCTVMVDLREAFRDHNWRARV
jgi:hypothetical protein